MRLRLGAGTLLLLASGDLAVRASTKTPTDDVRSFILRGTDSLDAALDKLGAALIAHDPDSTRVRSAFRRARVHYKTVEAVAEFYAPALAATLNSRRQEVDDDDSPPPSTLGPSGFPAIEPLVDGTTTMRSDSVRRLIDGMRQPVARLRRLAMDIVPTDAQVVEVAHLELVRVSTLGIAGFDAPRTGDAVTECAAALAGIRTLYDATGPHRWPGLVRERAALDSTLSRAIAYFRAHPDFASFDRLAYLVDYGEPAARALDVLRRASKTTPVLMRRGLRADASSPFVADAFDTRAYTPLPSPPQSRELISLGSKLFFDPSLSGTGSRSCASCHNPTLAFTDGVPTPASIDRHGSRVTRNTPTVINAGLQPAQFADERAATLEDQVVEVLRSPAEMGSSVDLAAKRLDAIPDYRTEFARAFGGDARNSVTPLRVRQALAAYVRSLVGLSSRFDKAVRGDTAQLTASERHGFNLFMGKGACGTCHFAPLFSGNTPPLYVNSDVEVIGTPRSPLRPRVPDADSGRARIDHRPEHFRAFKTPSLRNVAITGPYMHHGAFRTLNDVVKFYDGGGGAVANQTLPADSLHLSPAEQKAIVAFMGALTDTTRLSATAPAAAAPRGSHPVVRRLPRH